MAKKRKYTHKKFPHKDYEGHRYRLTKSGARIYLARKYVK